MKLALTIDDLPLWPHAPLPEGYTAAGIVDAMQSALAEHGLEGVYAFCNSWAIVAHPALSDVLDGWVANGHHVANHTHSHRPASQVSADDFVADIDLAGIHLRPWLAQAPQRLFRHPTCDWGETQDKVSTINAHLGADNWRAVDVTTWAYEWIWNRAYEAALGRQDTEAIAFLKSSFLDFSGALLHHDAAIAETCFGTQVPGTSVIHNVPFMADIASDYIGRLEDEGAEFIPLAEALSPPVQDAVGSFATTDFLVLPQKLMVRTGQRPPRLPDSQTAVFEKVRRMGGI